MLKRRMREYHVSQLQQAKSGHTSHIVIVMHDKGCNIIHPPPPPVTVNILSIQCSVYTVKNPKHKGGGIDAHLKFFFTLALSFLTLPLYFQ